MLAQVMHRQLSISFAAWRDEARVRAALKGMGAAVCRRLLLRREGIAFTHWKVAHFLSYLAYC